MYMQNANCNASMTVSVALRKPRTRPISVINVATVPVRPPRTR